MKGKGLLGRRSSEFGPVADIPRVLYGYERKEVAPRGICKAMKIKGEEIVSWHRGAERAG